MTDAINRRLQPIDLAISPCPNDTFIFHHLSRNGAELLGAPVRLEFADVEELNRRAIQERRHAVTKLSFYAMSQLGDHYQMLGNGGALGRGCGPLLITNQKGPVEPQDIRRVLIPGRYTTANLLTHLFFADLGLSPDEIQSIEFEAVRYEQILPALREGRADFGVIIHEERFTFERAGLFAVRDLGAWWEDTTGLPIPLGCIAARKDVIAGGLSAETIEAAIRSSLAHAYAHPEAGREFIKTHAQALEDEVIAAHIDLYVNDFSRDLGEDGRRAVTELFRRAALAGI
ncbi:MAG: 1,4-dihydroxy-6-naphthoate synthase [Leptospirales bacterium]|jgi:1,4-dihydroxy-6-naphthoate synthase